MKNLRFIELQLMSRGERAAFVLPFHQKITVITGENDVGKSSLLKSIYWVFGAEAAKTHPSWKQALSSALLHFSLDGSEYRILRERNRFAVFDAQDRMIRRASRIGAELAPFLADLFHFRLVLSARQSAEPTIPPPSFCFLPFYVDQDEGWGQTWRSFHGLGQFENWKRDVIFFHSGIRPNEFYELKASATRIRRDRDEILAERKVLTKAASRLERDVAIEALSFDESEYEDLIHRLLTALMALRDRRQAYAVQLTSIIANRASLEEQLAITYRALKEYDGDVRWLAQHTEGHVICPVCATEHVNDFGARFGILEDRESCRTLAADLADELDLIERDVSAARLRLHSADDEASGIEQALTEKRGELALQDVIRSEGQRQASAAFDREIEELTVRIESTDASIADIERSLKEFDDPKRREKIEDFYAGHVGRLLRRLNVDNISFKDIVKIDKPVQDTGSDQPRAVLAYDLAFFHTMRKYSSSVFAPMVIDSPVQQDQDERNAAAIIAAILEDRPDDSQIILGTVSLHGNKFVGRIINLKNKLKVLDEGSFAQVEKSMAPYMEALLMP